MKDSCHVHVMHCEEPWFSKIQSGIKPVEGRKGSVKNRLIQPGDSLLFCCDDRQFLTLVKHVDAFATVLDYLNEVSLEAALPGVSSIEEGLRIYSQWSTDEEIHRLGFLGIWVECQNCQ